MGTSAPSQKRIVLEMTAQTVESLRTMARMTGVAEGSQQRAQVIQDALRIYSWILQHQAQHRYIVVLPEADLCILERAETPLSGKREMLETFVRADVTEGQGEERGDGHTDATP